MHMHPTVTHAAADHRRQDYLAEAATTWRQRDPAEQLTLRRSSRLLWSLISAADGFFTWLTREFSPAPQSLDLEPRGGRPLADYGRHTF